MKTLLLFLLLVASVASAQNLPTRTSGLDPQGHLPAGLNPHGPLCPGQYTYTDGDGFPIFCWGNTTPDATPQPPDTTAEAPEPTSYPKFDTAEAAATAALKQIADKRGGAYEWGGMIGKTSDGRYAYSVPSTDYEGDNVMIRRTDLPPGMSYVGGYHTHPCLPHHDVEFFSPEDLYSVIFGHEDAAFMGDFCTGNVHEFKRGDQPDVIEQNGIWLTKGRIVGQFTTAYEMPRT